MTKKLFFDKLKRQIIYFKYNLRDFYDSYVAPSIRPAMTPLGFIFTGSNSVHHKAMQQGNFEPIEVEWLSREFKNIDVFVDIGANAGYFSCLARALGKSVVAVEPLWANLQNLLRNIELNNGPPIEIFPVALSSEVGVMRLYGFSSTGASLLVNWAGAPAVSSRLVPVTTLDNIVAERFLDKQLLIKIDVEGFEWEVIQGSEKILDRKKKPIWLIEITGSQFHPAGCNPNFEKIYMEFWRRGYSCFTLASGGATLIEPGDFQEVNRCQSQGLINYVFQMKDTNH
jgi:FkbM family methyltransferase